VNLGKLQSFCCRQLSHCRTVARCRHSRRRRCRRCRRCCCCFAVFTFRRCVAASLRYFVARRCLVASFPTSHTFMYLLCCSLWSRRPPPPPPRVIYRSTRWSMGRRPRQLCALGQVIQGSVVAICYCPPVLLHESQAESPPGTETQGPCRPP